jgi:4-aminobutyrate aminotransferase-like enzyme
MNPASTSTTSAINPGASARTGEPRADDSGTSPTVGSALRASPAVKAAVRQIVDEVRAKAALITDVRAADPALKESYDALMKRAAEVRGKALLYPYVGSGAGNGALVELADGSIKWDMICGIGVYFFGHADADMVEAAVLSGIDDTVKHGNLQSTFEPYEFAETLLGEARKHSRLRHAYIATSGAMANENALKVCVQKRFVDQITRARSSPDMKIETLLANTSAQVRAIAFADCFMGRSLTMANVGDNHQGREGLPGNVPVDYMPFWNPAAAERLGSMSGGSAQGKRKFIDNALERMNEYVHRFPGAHACFIFELVQGEGGFQPGDRDYFKALMDFCRAHGIAIWDDEIQTFGRTRRMFAYEHFDLGEYVDVFCVGKMTQACATLWTEEFNPKTSLLSGTFTGEGVSFRVGQRVIERLRDGRYYDMLPGSGGSGSPGVEGLIAQHEKAFRAECMKLIAKHPEWFPAVDELGGGGEKLVGGAGGMMRFTPFGGVKDKVMKLNRTCFDEGVVLFYCGHGPYHVRMLPPLGVMKLEDWPRVFACIERGMAKAAG